MTPARITASADPHPGYRPCVGIVLLNRVRRVFLGRRDSVLDKPWQMPQGGIEPGERPVDAAARELLEETGVRNARVLAESRWWYAYDLPERIATATWAGRWSGQTQRWFVFGFFGQDSEICLDRHHVEFVDWQWATAEQALDLAVDFKRPVYADVLAEFRDLLRPAEKGRGSPPC